MLGNPHVAKGEGGLTIALQNIPGFLISPRFILTLRSKMLVSIPPCPLSQTHHSAAFRNQKGDGLISPAAS